MNLDEQNFQKRLVVWQLLATIIATVGAVMLAYGFSLILFSSQLGIDSIIEANENSKELEIISQIASEVGTEYITTGFILLFGFPLVMIFVIAKEKIKHKKSKFSKLQILVDEMYDGKDVELIKRGYEAFSVRKLCLEGKPLRSDYSVLNYVKENNMILITEDPENHHACQENNLQCIKLGQNPSIEVIIKELELLKNISP